MNPHTRSFQQIEKLGTHRKFRFATTLRTLRTLYRWRLCEAFEGSLQAFERFKPFTRWHLSKHSKGSKDSFQALKSTPAGGG
jgi:hypothetical protein